MQSKNVQVIALALAAAILLGAGVAIGWFARQSDVDEAETRAEMAEAQAESAESTPDTPSADATTPADEAPPTEEPAEEAEDSSDITANDGRYPALIKSIDPDGAGWEIVVDYVLFLTGTEAEDAATAHGDESPPPNDYYVVNDNPKLRTFPIGSTCMVDMQTAPGPDETITIGDYTIPFSEFRTDRYGASDYYVHALYWLQITNGEVVNIEEQYLP